jgi:hypothetical protein
MISLHCADHHSIGIQGDRERLVTASPVVTKSRAPARGNNYPENGLVEPPRRDARVPGPAGMFGGTASLCLVVQKRRLHAPSVPMRSAPVYFCFANGEFSKTRNQNRSSRGLSPYKRLAALESQHRLKYFTKRAAHGSKQNFALCKRVFSPVRNVLEGLIHKPLPKTFTGDASLLIKNIS